MSQFRRIVIALLAVLAVVVIGSVGYMVLGWSPLDAVYQTVTTITTVGFSELHPLHTGGKIFTIVLILAGVGTALYAFSVVLESLVEGHLRQHFERRRMERDIARMSGHTIVCGWGRVGRSVAGYLSGMGAEVVVVDLDADRVAGISYPAVVGDVTDDGVLHRAGVMRARSLVAAINTDALPPALKKPEGLARALITIHDGAMLQLLIDPDQLSLMQWLHDLLIALLDPPTGLR